MNKDSESIFYNFFKCNDYISDIFKLKKQKSDSVKPPLGIKNKNSSQYHYTLAIAVCSRI